MPAQRVGRIRQNASPLDTDSVVLTPLLNIWPQIRGPQESFQTMGCLAVGLSDGETAQKSAHLVDVSQPLWQPERTIGFGLRELDLIPREHQPHGICDRIAARALSISLDQPLQLSHIIFSVTHRPERRAR